MAINLIRKFLQNLCNSRRQSKIVTINGESIKANLDSLNCANLDHLDLNDKADDLEDDLEDDNLRKDHQPDLNFANDQINTNCKSNTNSLKALLNNLCYQVVHCDEKHQTNTKNDLIIIK